MAIDFDAIRKKLGQLSGSNSKRRVMWRPPQDETTTVRLIAFTDNDGNPFKERYFYYNIGNNPGLLAPYQFGKPDPINELIQKFKGEGTKEGYEMAKKLYAIRINNRNETKRHNMQSMCKPIKSSEELERYLGKILKDSDLVTDQEASKIMKNRILNLSTWHSYAGSDLCDTITNAQCRELYMLLYRYIFNFSKDGEFGEPEKEASKPKESDTFDLF